MIKFFKGAFNYYVDAFSLFYKRKGTVFAAAASFYFVIALVPLILLIARLTGLLMGNLSQTQEKIFFFLGKLFPKLVPEFLVHLKEIVGGPLFGAPTFAYINLILLIITSLTFFNSLWNGLYLITEDRIHQNFTRHLKGPVVIGITVILLIIIILIPPFYYFVLSAIKNNVFILALKESFPLLLDYLTPFFSLLTDDFGEKLLLHSDIISTLIILLYFTFLYRWFFFRRITWLVALTGSFTFVLLMYAGKKLFWAYLTHVRSALVANYGDFYTFMVGLLWIFLLMCFFFYGACLCSVSHSSWEDHPDFSSINRLKRDVKDILMKLRLRFWRFGNRIFKQVKHIFGEKL